MSRFIARIFVLLCLSGLSVSAQPAVTDIGPIEIQSQLQTLSVRVTASPEELNRLANLAFEVHGRYRRVTSNPSFDIRFTAVSGNRVQVDVARGSSRVMKPHLYGHFNAQRFAQSGRRRGRTNQRFERILRL